MKKRVLSEHFESVKAKLLQYSKHFDIANHGDIKGYGREALVNELLKTHLPDQIEYLNGEIIDEKDAKRKMRDTSLILEKQTGDCINRGSVRMYKLPEGVNILPSLAGEGNDDLNYSFFISERTSTPFFSILWMGQRRDI